MSVGVLWSVLRIQSHPRIYCPWKWKKPARQPLFAFPKLRQPDASLPPSGMCQTHTHTQKKKIITNQPSIPTHLSSTTVNTNPQRYQPTINTNPQVDDTNPGIIIPIISNPRNLCKLSMPAHGRLSSVGGNSCGMETQNRPYNHPTIAG